MLDVLASADLCVKCGLCLPHCPTYTLSQDENASPRGRIALIQAWAAGRLALSPTLLQHLDTCLLCRSCERVCPAAVPYGALLDSFRSQTRQQRKRHLRVEIVKKLAGQRRIRQIAQTVSRVYQTSGVQKISRTMKLPQGLRLQSLERLLPSGKSANQPLAAFYPASAEQLGSVALFVGCLGEWLEPATLAAAIRVLTAVGYAVHVPPKQTCCGALACHDGDTAVAQTLLAQNTAVFNALAVDAVISVASGCGGHLHENLPTHFANKLLDINVFLAQSPNFAKLKFKPRPDPVWLHTPCSLRNQLRAEHSVPKLLRQIPELTVLPLPDTLRCCGAAGSYALTQPVWAEALLQTLITSLPSGQTGTLLTTNIGCALHIQAGLSVRGDAWTVKHPVTLLAECLADNVSG